MRELNEQLVDLDARITAAEAAVNEMQARIAQRQEDVGHHAAAHRQATEVLGEHRMTLTAAEERRAQFQQQRAALDGECRAASVQHDAAVGRLAEAREKRQRNETGLSEMEARLAGFQEQVARLEGERQARNRDTTETKVELAKSEERLRSLRCACGSSMRPARNAAARSTRAASNWSFASSGPRPRAGTSCGPSRSSPTCICARRLSPPRRSAS